MENPEGGPPPKAAAANMAAMRQPETMSITVRPRIRWRLPHRRHWKALRDTSFPHLPQRLCTAFTA